MKRQLLWARASCAIAIVVLSASSLFAQTTAGTSATIVVPVIAQTPSFGSEVTAYNPNGGAITVNVSFYDAENTASPGPKACTALSLPAGRSAQFSVAGQCALPAGSNFGLLILTEQTGTQRFYGYARTQTPGGVGFSTEGFPIENFNDQLQHATGIKRLAAAGNLPAFQTNCFVGTLGDTVDYELRLFNGTTNAQIGGTLAGSLQPYQQYRYLDVFAQAGAPAGDLTNVRAEFTNLTAANKKLIGFCTVQENTTFSADFRIAKSYGGTPQNAFVQGGNAFGVTAVLGTVDNQAVKVTSGGGNITLDIGGGNGLRIVETSGALPDAPNTVNGSANNSVSDQGGTVAGGGYAGNNCYDVPSGLSNRPCGNRALNGWSTVGGGSANFASATWATVGGGFGNTANGAWSSVAGGRDNYANGLYSTVPGGYNNQALGPRSFAAGTQATIPATAGGSFLWSDSTGPVTLPAGGHDQFIVAATNGIGLYTYKDFSHGCYLVGLAAAWVCTSDRATKADITAIEPRDVLARLVDMPIAQWRFKGERETVRHIGPMAQDFRASFGLGYDDKGIAGVDADGVAFAAIQGLHQLVEEKDARILALERRLTEVEALRGEVAALRLALEEMQQAKAALARRN